MRFPLRAAFAALLWLVAAWPIALIAIAASSPPRAMQLEDAVVGTAHRLLLWIGIAAALALVLWPPFLPSLVLWFRKIRQRLSVNRLPTLEALDRLRSFENPADHLTAGRGLLAQGVPRQAVAHLVRAIELDGKDLRARFLLAQALTQLGALKDAAQILDQVVTQDSEHGFGDAMLLLAELNLKLGATETAAAALERFVARYGKRRQALFLLFLAQRELGKKKEALAALQDAARPLAKEERRDPSNRYWKARATVARWTAGGIA